jgi:tetratricopeptide (TPR) repeat protein
MKTLCVVSWRLLRRQVALQGWNGSVQFFMKSLQKSLLVISLVLGFGPHLYGQIQSTPQVAKPPEAKTKEEHEAYVTFYQEKDPMKKLEMGNKFLTGFATSDFRPNVMLLMIQGLQGTGQAKTIVDLGERFLIEFPEHPSKAFVFQALMVATQELNNLNKTVEYGERLLQADPNNLSAIYTICFILSERNLSSDEEGRKKELSRATEVVHQGLKMPKPTQLSEERWAQYQAALHSSFGLINLNNREYAQAQAEYGKAIAVIKNDPILFFRSGLAFSYDKKYDEAIDALSKSVYLKGITETQAKTELERVYRIKNGITTTGPELQAAIQKVVDEAGTKLK